MMKKLNSTGSLSIIVVIGIIVVVLASAAYFLMGNNKLALPGQSNNKQLQTTHITQPTETAKVSITANGFEPATLTVKSGTQITFTNTDKVQHQVASDPHPTHTGLPGFEAKEPLNPGDSYSFTFEKIGTFTYHDHLNPFKLKGTVIVQ